MMKNTARFTERILNSNNEEEAPGLKVFDVVKCDVVLSAML